MNTRKAFYLSSALFMALLAIAPNSEAGQLGTFSTILFSALSFFFGLAVD